jgi:hypothetical protein
MNRFLRIIMAGLICGVGMIASIAVADVSLVHRYSFNDDTANDSIGKAHGKALNGVTIYGGQAHFTGSPGQRIELLANGVAGISIGSFKAVTLEAWYTADKAQTWQRLFEIGESKSLEAADSTGANSINFIITTGYTKQGGSAATISNSDPSFTGEQAVKIEALPLNQENHIAVVVDAMTITLFVNGMPAGKEPMGDRALAKLSNDFALLGHSLYGGNPSLAGSINDFRIYKGAATAAEIAASFKAGPYHPVTGLGK